MLLYEIMGKRLTKKTPAISDGGPHDEA